MLRHISCCVLKLKIKNYYIYHLDIGDHWIHWIGMLLEIRSIHSILFAILRTRRNLKNTIKAYFCVTFN